MSTLVLQSELDGVLQRELKGLVLQLKGLVHVRALLEGRGASSDELTAHTDEIARVRDKLARLAKAQGMETAQQRHEAA